MPKDKIPHLLYERGRYYYQRRVPQRFQSAIGHKKWRSPVGADFPEAVDRVRALTKKHNELLEKLVDPEEFRKAKTAVRRSSEAEESSQNAKLDKDYAEWLTAKGLNDDPFFGLDENSRRLNKAKRSKPWESAQEWFIALDHERMPAPNIELATDLIKAKLNGGTDSTQLVLPPYPEYRELVAQLPRQEHLIKFAESLPEPMDDDEYHDRLVEILNSHFGKDTPRPDDPDDQDEFDLVRNKLERKISRVAYNPDTVSKIAERYYGFAQIKPRTRDKYRRTLKRLIGQVGDIPVKHLSPELLRAFRNHLAERGNLSSSIRADFTPIIGMLNFAVDEGILDSSPMAGVRLPKEKRSIEESKWLPFKPEEMRRIFTGVDEIWSTDVRGLSSNRRKGLQMAVRTLAYSAMRPSELLALTPADVDAHCFRIRGGKTKSATRVVPVHPELADIPSWIQTGGLEVFRNQRTSETQTDPVTALRHNFMRLIKELLPEPVTGERKALYSLRSTFQNSLRRAGAPIAVRRAIMGHVEQGAMRHYDDGPEFELLRKWVFLADPLAD